MITQRVSAERLLVTVALLRVYLNFVDTERYANEAIAYYATTIGEERVAGQKDVALDYLADSWLDDSSKLLRFHRLLASNTDPLVIGRRDSSGGTATFRLKSRSSN